MSENNLKDVFVGVLNEVDFDSVQNVNGAAMAEEFKQWLKSRGFKTTPTTGL